MNLAIAELLAHPYIPRILEAVLGATLIFFAVVSVILLYHWGKYESVNSRTVFIIIIYFGVSIILSGGAARYLFLFIK